LSSRRRHTRFSRDWSSDVCSSDLYDVVMNVNPGVYHDPHEFFALTYPTVKLRDLARDVTHRLAGKSEKAVRQLHMTFGGGKTHRSDERRVGKECRGGEWQL